MKLRILSLLVIMLGSLCSALPLAEYSGNHTGPFKTALQKLFAEKQTHPVFTLPSDGTRAVIWSQLGRTEDPQMPEDILELQSFVKKGGILILCSAVPTQAFAGANIFDLSPAAALLGAQNYVYSNPKSELRGAGAELFSADANIYESQKENHPGLGGLCGMSVLIGSDKVAELGLRRIGAGAVIYSSAAPTDATYATALQRLLTAVMAPAEFDRLFPLPESNRAAVVDGKTLHLSLSVENERSVMPDLLPRLLGKRSYDPLPDQENLLIHIGQTPYVKSLGLDFESLHPYGYFMVMRDGRNLVLAGKNAGGTAYAVVDFLKRYLGYRRFSGPQELFEIVPVSEALTLPATLNIREEPSIHSYILAWEGSTAVFGRNSRLTCQATHALDHLVPPAKYGATHPEYFPLINGQRIKVGDNGKIGGPWNPCISNPDLPKLVAEYAEEYFSKHPDSLGLPMGVNDGGGDCQCPSCLAELQETGNQYARFYNMAAKVLAEKYPSKVISFIAYSAAATKAPRGVKMEPNILVEITGMGGSAFNRYEQWKDTGIKHFGLYDYIYMFGGGYVTPRYYPRVMAKAWREAKQKYNLQTMWMELYPVSSIFDAPRQYVLDEIAWNMDANVEALLDDCFNALYAEAAKPAKQFFDIHEQVYERKTYRNAPISDWKRFRQMDEYTREDLQNLDRELKNALDSVRNPLAKKRLELLAKTWEFSRQRIEGNILSRELSAMTEIASDADVARVVNLVNRAYQNIADCEAYSMTQDEEALIFNNPQKNGLASIKKYSPLLPQPNIEQYSDPALEQVTAYFKKQGQDIKEFYRKTADGAVNDAAKAAFLTQSYVRTNQLVNLVKNPSFEETSGNNITPLLSDHIALKEVPGWSSWTFPSSVTKFFLNAETARSGKYSCAIGERQIGGAIIAYVSLQPYCRYRLSFWVRRNRGDDGYGMGSANIRMQGKRGWLDDGSAITAVYPPECENNWVKCSTNFSAPDEPATALIILSAIAQPQGVWTAFDDVSLEKIFEPEDLKKKMNRLILNPPAQLEKLPQTRLALQTAEELIGKNQPFLPALSVNLTHRDAGADGAFDIALNGNQLSITGSDEGLRCGLYTLLNTLGFHWFNPAEKITSPVQRIEPDLASLVGHHAPDFSYRGLHICAGKHHFDDTVGRWMSFNRMNRKLTHLPEDDIVGERLQELGLRPDTTVHAYSLLIPDEKYYDTHPEFFSLVGGKRIRQSNGGQLCLSNQEMRTAFTSELLEKIRSKPHLGVFGFCPNDGYGHCECEKCRALDSAEDLANKQVNRRVADFVQDICARVEREAPAVMLGHYSYSNFSNFLDHLPNPPKNLIVSCTMFHCYSHSVFDPDCPKNPPHAERLKNILGKIRHVYIYDYFSHNWGRLPAPYWDAVIRDFKEFKRLGVDGWMSECSGAEHQMWEAQWSVFYLAGKLLWNCNTDTDAFLQKLCQARYGDAAAPMTRYFQTLQKSVLRKDACLDKNPDAFKAFFTPQIQKACAADLKAAGNSAFVKAERALFDFQCSNYAEREKYSSATAITPGSLDAEAQKLFLVDRSSQLPNLENDTKVWVAADERSIRFRMLMQETKMDKLKINRKSPYDGDSIELFLNHGTNPEICFHFIFAPDGSTIASECEGPRWNWAWKHQAKVEGKKHDNAWELLVEIPLQDIHATNSFGFTIIRNRHTEGWQIYGTPAGGAYFNPKNYIRCNIK